MPTPDETAFPPSPPIDIPARSLFASCPPEEDRESEASRDDDEHDTEDTVAGAEREDLEDHAIAQEPTPEPEAHSIEVRGSSESRSQEKGRSTEDPRANDNPPSPITSPDPAAATDMHAQAAPSATTPAAFPPQYLEFTSEKQRV